jgi:hypothetical protein
MISANQSYLNNKNLSFSSNSQSYYTYNNYHNNNNSKTTTIKVAIRLRPLLPHEDFEYWVIDPINNLIKTSFDSNYNKHYKKDKNNSYLQDPNSINQLLLDNIYIPQSFKFDKIFTKETTSEKIYLEMCQDIIKGFLNGINGTIFTYGQTTSGKTYTMLGNVDYPGILPCSLKNLFDLLEMKKKEINFNYNLYCSYVEIYNEIIHDLIGDSTGCKIVEDNNYGLIVSDAQRVCINSFEEGVQLKDLGEEKRQYKNTIINEYSSRSHTIFQLFLETSTQGNDSNTVYKKYSLLNLVDLAGSERVNKDENNNTNNETGYINKSLFALANVINKLSENKNIHIPYRDSKLTRLLSVALGGGSLVNIICNISPSASNYFQTVSTLRFANRAKNIKIKPAINEKIIRKYNEKHRTINFYNTSNNYYINRNNLINQRNKNELFKDYEDDTSNTNLESINYNGSIDYQRKYYELLLKNKELISENNKLKSTVENFMELNKNNNNSEINFIDRCIEKIKFLILKTNNSKEINQYINNNLMELKMNYLNQLKSIQNLYLSKVNELQNAIMTNLSNNNKDNEKSNYETDDENNFEFFSEVDLDFGHVNDIKDVKLIYESKEQQLEQLMTKYKENTDLYFVNLLKNSNDKKSISELYKERMSELENLYENAQNKLEKNFFKKLREITDFIKQNNH